MRRQLLGRNRASGLILAASFAGLLRLDRFADGWDTSDVAATDPGAADGAAAGLHSVVGGSLMFLDGQRSTRVPGTFGQMPDQTSAALSRDGHQVASVVTLRPGAPDMASALWIGDSGVFYFLNGRPDGFADPADTCEV